MNRRNFIKLFGLLAAVPTSASALRGINVPPSFQQMRARKKKREINLYITLENRFHEVHGKHRVIVREKLKNGHYRFRSASEWSDTCLVHGRYVEADDKVSIETQNGTSISFGVIPHSHQEGKFESMNVTTELNGWNYELDVNPIL